MSSADNVFDKLYDMNRLGDLVKQAPADQIPAEQMQMLEQIRTTDDSISFPGGPMGDITLKRVEAERPYMIKLDGIGTPVAMSLTLRITPETDQTCQAQVEFDLAIPAMLKPMVSGAMNKMTSQFADMLRNIPFN